MKMLKKIFNTNTGYFIKKVTYDFRGNYEIGYVLCKGYVIFGIPGYDVIGVYTDKPKLEQCNITETNVEI
jgi:hypothetical protein